MDYTVFKTKILTKSSKEVANASLFEILLNIVRYCVSGNISDGSKELAA
jgi:hypothetical protein